MNEQLSILDIIDMLLRKWMVIVVSAVLVGIFAFVYSEVFISPVYSSKASLYVNSSREVTSTEISTANMNSSRQLVMTYAEILQARTFLEKVAQDMNNKYTVNEIKSMITMEALNETEILSITVKGTNADDVYKITRSITKYAPHALVRVFEAGSVKVLDNASETNTPISPNIRQNTFIGIFIGILLGAFIIIVLELFDTRIKNGNEIRQRYEEPLLGEIPSFVRKDIDPNSNNQSGRRANK